MNTDLATHADEEVLRQCLEPAIAELLGGRPTIAAIRHARFDLATSYDARVVTVGLNGGQTLRVFVKDFGFTVRPKDGPRERREREVGVYRDLLRNGAELGTARYYGSVLDE